MHFEQRSGENVISAAVSPTVECVCDGPDRTIMTVFVLLQEAEEVCDEEGSIGLCNGACSRRQLAQCEMTEQKDHCWSQAKRACVHSGQNTPQKDSASSRSK